jgi:hypothetical protein
METITISLKTLTGELLPLTIPEGASGHDVYLLAFEALPEEIRPPYTLNLDLFPDFSREEKSQEFLYDSDVFPAKDGDVFCVFIRPSVYTVAMDFVSEARDDETEMEYDHYRMVIIRDDIEAIYSSDFYATVGEEEVLFFSPRQVRVVSVASSPYECISLSEGDLVLVLSLGGLRERIRPLLLPVPVSDSVREDLLESFLFEWEYISQSFGAPRPSQ